MMKKIVLGVPLLVFVCDNVALGQLEVDKGIKVSGVGCIIGRPDVATTNIGVESMGSSLEQVKNKSNSSVDIIIKKLKSMGVADKDIQTRAYTISTLTDTSLISRAQKITGYRINNRLQVKIRNLADLGIILESVVASGANDIAGISFEIDNPKNCQIQARQLAVKDAREKAEQLARDAGIQLGKILSIIETGDSGKPAVYRSMSMKDMANAPVPIEAGEMEIVVHVDMRFDIQD